MGMLRAGRTFCVEYLLLSIFRATCSLPDFQISLYSLDGVFYE